MPPAEQPPPPPERDDASTAIAPGGSVVLLALFDGIGGAGVALRQLGLSPVAEYSCEVDVSCCRVLAERFPSSVQLGDVRKLSGDVLADLVTRHPADSLWLVVGGSPCQDLSVLRGAARRGLEGTKSKLFWEWARVVAQLMRLRRTAFLLENVASMRDSDRDEISRALGVPPVTLDATPWCGCRRNRHYWTNIRGAALDPPADGPQIDSKLDPGWTRPGNTPFRCFVASASRTSGKLRTVSGDVVLVSDPAQQREPNADEREALLGFPRGWTRVGGLVELKRLRMVGNSFAVPVVAELLRPVASWAGGAAPLRLGEVDSGSTLARMDRIVPEDAGDAGDLSDLELDWD